MAKPDLGFKRVCGNCGTKFYDFGRSPIVCPKCGTVYAVTGTARAAVRPEPVAEAEEAELPPAGAEIISLEEAEAETAGKKKPATADADVDADEDVEVEGGDEDDTFLEEEEEESGDVSDIIGEKLEEDREG